MRSPLNALRPYAQEQAQITREKLAAAAFELGAAKLAIVEAAARGELAVKLPLTEPVELRGTKAAAELAAWATKNKLTLEWVERVAERPNGLKAMIGEPLISWGEERHSSH